MDPVKCPSNIFSNNTLISRYNSHDNCNNRMKESFPIPGDIPIQVNTKYLYNICTMLVQRRRRWTDVVQMLYKCFVFDRIRALGV